MALDPLSYPATSGTGPAYAGLEHLRQSWGWLLAAGIALIVVGFLAIGSSLITTLATVVVFGILLLVGSGVQVASAIWARRWGGFFLHLLAGILYFVAGALIIDFPLEMAVALTFLIAIMLLVGGLARIIMALVDRFPGWGWVLLNGVISFLLGIMIERRLPWSGLWVIGLFVGIEMLFSGWSWVMLALAARPLPPRPTPVPTTPH